MTIFSKCRSLYPHLCLPLLLAVSAGDRSWTTSATFFEDFIKRSGELESTKTAVFDLLESFFHRATEFIDLFLNIYNMVFIISAPFVRRQFFIVA